MMDPPQAYLGLQLYRISQLVLENSVSFKIIMTTSVTSTVIHNIAPELQDQDRVFGLWSVLSYDRKSQTTSLIKTDTYCSWMSASRLLLTVQPHHWWRADEHLCIMHDSSDQLNSSLGGQSLLCNNRRWPWKDKWSQQDNLHIGNIYLFTIVQKRLQGLGTEDFSAKSKESGRGVGTGGGQRGNVPPQPWLRGQYPQYWCSAIRCCPYLLVHFSVSGAWSPQMFRCVTHKEAAGML